MPSQVVVSRTLSKKQMLMSVCTKIGIQLNCKLGGEIWAVEVPVKNIMVIGIDVYHDSLTKGKSIVGFVASTNANLTRYLFFPLSIIIIHFIRIISTICFGHPTFLIDLIKLSTRDG